MNEAENKKEYEMSYFISPEVLEDKLNLEIEELSSLISKSGGNITQTQPLEMKRLAYPVKKYYQAYFGVVYFTLNTEGIDKIKKALTFHKKIIRFLILNNPVKPRLADETPEKSKVLQPQNQSFDQKLENILNR